MMRRAAALALIAVVVTGCSKAVEIPRADIDDPKYREPGSYRIRTEGWNEYLVSRFSVTDSTIVIEGLLPSDERFRTGRNELPISVPRGEIASISQLETDRLMTTAILIPITLVAVIVGWFIVEGGGSFGN